MSITIKPFEYKDGKTTCIGQVAWDESYASPKPGVIINHAWGGLDDFAQDKAIQMAAIGFVGVCLDNYGNGAQPETNDERMATMSAIKDDRKVLAKRLKAGYTAACALDMVDESAMAAMGFCFGGLCTLDMARAGLDLKAAISYHGLLDVPDLPKKTIKADVLVCHGYDDPMSDPDALRAVQDELASKKCDWTVMSFGNTKHAFMVPSANDPKLGLQYNEFAATQSWAASTDLLNKHFQFHGVDQDEASA